LSESLEEIHLIYASHLFIFISVVVSSPSLFPHSPESNQIKEIQELYRVTCASIESVKVTLSNLETDEERRDMYPSFFKIEYAAVWLVVVLLRFIVLHHCLV
jgi:hypothetical protein